MKNKTINQYKFIQISHNVNVRNKKVDTAKKIVINNYLVEFIIKL